MISELLAGQLCKGILATEQRAMMRVHLLAHAEVDDGQSDKMRQGAAKTCARKAQ